MESSGTPRWAKVFGIIAIALALLAVGLLLTGKHGPGRHMSAGIGVRTPSLVVAEHGIPRP